MYASFYLTVSRGGSIRLTKSKPNLKFNEISMKMELSVPDRIFERPTIKGEIRISDDAVAPAELRPEVILQTKELIEQATGFKVELIAVPPTLAIEPVKEA